MKIRTSWDDGCASDVRVAELLDKYNLPGTFYIPVEWHSLAYDHGYEPITYRDIQDIDNDFNIGSHGITHSHLTKMPEDLAKYEIRVSKYMLEELISGYNIYEFAPPRGYLNETLMSYAKEYYAKVRLTKGYDLIHVHPDSGANDNRKWQEVAKEKMAKYDVVELWGHSWELDKYDMWTELEEFIRGHA